MRAADQLVPSPRAMSTSLMEDDMEDVLNLGLFAPVTASRALAHDELEPGSLAEQAGARAGDVLLAVNGTACQHHQQALSLIESAERCVLS